MTKWILTVLALGLFGMGVVGCKAEGSGSVSGSSAAPLSLPR